MKIVFGSVVYPKAFGYFENFLDSLDKQTIKDFSLLLLNDGVDDAELYKVIQQHHVKNEVIKYSNVFSPAELRVKLFEESRSRKTDYLILGDVDDTFSPNRIEKIVETFEVNSDVAFVYNRLMLEDKKNIMPDMPIKANSLLDILELNFLGLSNTAIRLNTVSKNFISSLYECKSQVFDWYLFSRLLLYGLKGIMEPNIVTYYRIHENNYAGIPRMEEKMIGKEIKIKKEHYRMLNKYHLMYKMLMEDYENNNFELNSEQANYFWWNLTRRRTHEV